MEYKTFHGVDENSLTTMKKKAANINRGYADKNPVIRARRVLNGRLQRGLYLKEETVSPTILQEAFFISIIVDAVKERDVVVTDVKDAYLNAKTKDKVIMKITSPEIKMFCKLDPSLQKFVTYKKRKSTLIRATFLLWLLLLCI